MGKYLAGIDVGTTGARCCLFDCGGSRVGSAYREYGAQYPRPGWVDQDARAMLAQTMEACAAAVKESGVAPADIASIGFSTQRSVTCPVGADGELVRPMISWQDARSGKQVEWMRSRLSPEAYYELSGLPLGTTWIITKLLWMRDEEPENYRRAVKFVQNQDLALKAFGADDFYTDVSDMAFYGVWDTKGCAWSEKLMRLFEVGPELFGKPVPPGTQVGTLSREAAAKTGFAVGTPLCVGAGDQNCSVVGMGAVKSGMATVTLGTAGLAILATDRPVPGFGGMMITNHAKAAMWEVEGLSNAAASSLRWFRDEIAHMEKHEAERSGQNAYVLLDKLAAKSAPGARGLLFMPYLATAGTPRWNPDARAAFLGMSLAHGRADLTRAVMEGVVLEIRDMMEQWSLRGMKVDVVRLGGGAANSRQWNQIQADVYGRSAQKLVETESTALGAAILAGVGAGVFASIDSGVDAMVKVAEEVDPIAANVQLYQELYQAYDSAYNALSSGGVFKALAALQTK